MKKIAFFIDNSKISKVDFTTVHKGNPGVGGTEYMFILIVYLLSIRNNDIRVKLLVPATGIFPPEIDVDIATNVKEAALLSDKEEYDYFVFRHLREHIACGILNLPIHTTHFIVWCHNFVNSHHLDLYNQCAYISRIICVGREQMDAYMHKAAYRKSDYIYNSIEISDSLIKRAKLVPYTKRENIVTYIGSIVPDKGLHWLAEAWGNVLKEVPDAQLYIIGSGKLYFDDAQLGEWGIAEASYEKQLMKYFSDGENIIPSVHFTGVLGTEKYDILQKTKVGVPNPSGLTETFGITAIEMQILGTRVCTMQCPGYLDTVINGSLYKKKKNLANYIIKELRQKKNRYEDFMRFAKSNFSNEIIVADWEKLFNEAIPQKKHLHPFKFVNMSYRKKWAKYIIRKFADIWLHCSSSPKTESVKAICQRT